MRRAFWIGLVCLCLGSLQAQNAKLDFLEKQYEEALAQRDYTAVKRYALPWMTLYKELDLPRDVHYAEIECTLAFCLYMQYDFENSRALYEEAIRILRSYNALQPHADAVLRLVQIYVDEQKIPAAAALIKEITPYIEHPSTPPYVYAQWIILTNQIHIQQYNYTAAQEHLQRLLSRHSESTSHAYVQLCIQLAQADLALANRDYSKAEKYYTEIIHGVEEETDSLSIKFYASCQLGQVLTEQDNLQAAEVLYSNLLKRSLTDMDRKTILERLANICMDLGDYVFANRLYLEVADIVLSLYGDQHVEYAKSLTNLANVAFRQRQLVLAQKAYLESTYILKSLDVPALYALTLCNLANVYIYQNKMQEAELCYKEALHIIESQIGAQSLEYADALNNMAIMYHVDGDYRRAYQLYTRAQELREALAGKDSRKYLESETCLFNLFSDLDIPSMATPILQSILKKKSALVKQEFWHLSERQRKDFWDENKYAFEQTYPNYIYAHSQDTALRALAFDNELFVKGLLLNTSAQIKHAIHNSNNPLVQAIYSQLNSKKEILTLYQQTGKSQREIDAIKKEIDALDKRLALLCSEYQQNMANSSVNWHMVRDNLAANEVAIEFSHFSSGGQTHYIAILLRHNLSSPEYIEIGTGEEILPLVSGCNPNYIYTHNAQHLHDAIWKAVQQYIKPNDTIYFAPSGLIHQIAVESLPYDEKHAMADVYHLIRLSSTREVIHRKKELRHTTATLYGGINFQVDDDELLANSEKYHQVSVNLPVESNDSNRGSIDYLKGSKIEVENINQMLKESNMQVQLFTATNANEESFKALSGKRQNILHIATHGFFWTDSVARKKDYFTQRLKNLGSSVQSLPSIDPLNRCGLLLSGAQTAWSGHSTDLPEGVQDGILTAKEISLLDLREADLIVLSACETGKGEITGDGVFGLQRAFKQAGAQTLVMSLWKVNDAATQLLMTEFYRNWITEKQPKRKAFRNAQNAVRTYKDENGKLLFEEPFYWAGFVMLD